MINYVELLTVSGVSSWLRKLSKRGLFIIKTLLLSLSKLELSAERKKRINTRWCHYEQLVVCSSVIISDCSRQGHAHLQKKWTYTILPCTLWVKSDFEPEVSAWQVWPRNRTITGSVLVNLYTCLYWVCWLVKVFKQSVHTKSAVSKIWMALARLIFTFWPLGISSLNLAHLFIMLMATKLFSDFLVFAKDLVMAFQSPKTASNYH